MRRGEKCLYVNDMRGSDVDYLGRAPGRNSTLVGTIYLGNVREEISRLGALLWNARKKLYEMRDGYGGHVALKQEEIEAYVARLPPEKPANAVTLTVVDDGRSDR